METVSVPILNEASIEYIVELAVRKIKALEGPKKDETLMTTNQVCEEFKVSRVTLNNYRRDKKLLPFSKSGKMFTYKRCDVLEAFKYKI